MDNEATMQITHKVQMHLGWRTFLVFFFCGAKNFKVILLYLKNCIFDMVQLNCINSE